MWTGAGVLRHPQDFFWLFKSVRNTRHRGDGTLSVIPWSLAFRTLFCAQGRPNPPAPLPCPIFMPFPAKIGEI